MSRPHTRGWRHASRITAPIVDAKTKECPFTDSRPSILPQETRHLNHPLRRLDSREITQNYGRYYIEMVENIAAWLKGARVRALR